MNITCNEMKEIDSHAINTIKIPSIVLMERASLEVVNHINTRSNNVFTIICGIGNNGGDGLAIYRHLIQKDKDVRLFIVGDLNKATIDFNINLEILNNLDFDYINIRDKSDLNSLKHSLRESDVVIDSIFGIGLTRNIEGLFLDTIELVNAYSKYIVSIDIPSGLDGDSGKVLGISIKANKTISFHLSKYGLNNSLEYTGQVLIVDIGIAKKSTDTILNRR